MELVKGTLISFTDRFNECESKTKTLGIFSGVDNRVWKSETSLGGRNGRKLICVDFGVFPAQIFQGNGNGSKWIASERVTNAMGQE